MAKKLSKLQTAQQKAEAAAKKTNQKINELDKHTNALYTSLTTIQSLFDRIRNMPEENRLKYEKLKNISINWEQQVEKIEIEYKKTAVICWAIAGVSLWASYLMFFKTKSAKQRLENIYTLISDRDIKSYELAIVELSERITRIIDESGKLNEAIVKIKTFGTDYTKMTEAQQYELGAYVNLMEASTMLLVNPILGLQPKYSEQDFENLCATEEDSYYKLYFEDHKTMVISMANLLYKINLDDKDKKLLAKSLKKNKEFLSSVQMTKTEFDAYDISMIERALNHKYKYSTY